MSLYKADKVRFETRLVEVGECIDSEGDVIKLGVCHFYEMEGATDAIIRPMRSRIVELEEEIEIYKRALKRKEIEIKKLNDEITARAEEDAGPSL